MAIRKSKRTSIFGQSKGLITNVPPIELSPLALVESKNVFYQPGGGYMTRYGTSKSNATQITETAVAQAVHGLYHFKLAAGTDFLVVTAGTKVYKQDSADGTNDDITGGVTVTTGQNSLSSFTVMNDLLIIGQNTTNIIKWTGSGNVAALGGTPTIIGNIVMAYRDYLWITGDSSDPSRLYSSDLASPETFTDNVDIKVPFDDDGQVITGLASIGPDQVMLIFKNRSIYRLLGTVKSNFSVDIVDNTIGSINHASIVPVGNRIYFFNGIDFYYTDGFQTVNISRLRIGDLLDGTNQARQQYVTGTHSQKEHIIIWNITDSGSNGHDIALFYDYLLDAWGKIIFNGPTHNVMAVYQPFNVVPKLYIGGTNGYIYLYDTSLHTEIQDDDSTAAIDFELKTGPINSKESDSWFRTTYMTPKVEGAYDINITTDIDFGNSGGATDTITLNANRKTFATWILGTDPLGSPSRQKAQINWPTNQIGQFLQLDITAPAKNSRFNLPGFEQEYQQIGAR